MCELEKCTAQEQLLNMAMDIQLIKTALLGNEFSDNKGVIYKLNRVERKQDELERKINYRIGFAAGVGAVVGLAVSIIFKFI